MPIASQVDSMRRSTLVILSLHWFRTSVFGLAPALQTSATDLRSALTDGGRGGTGMKGGRMRRALVMGEIGLSVVLLISAVLLVKAFTHLRAADLGYDIEEVATMRLTLPEQKYPPPE